LAQIIEIRSSDQMNLKCRAGNWHAHFWSPCWRNISWTCLGIRKRLGWRAKAMIKTTQLGSPICHMAPCVSHTELCNQQHFHYEMYGYSYSSSYFHRMGHIGNPTSCVAWLLKLQSR
jgi:hypothetical protein